MARARMKRAWALPSEVIEHMFVYASRAARGQGVAPHIPGAVRLRRIAVGPVRRLENRFYGQVRHPASAEVARADPQSWSTTALARHKYCLLTSFRASGRPVSVPVWFGTDGERIYIRSGPEDGKVKRIRRNPQVLITPCTARGRPLGGPMPGSARILAAQEHGHAEAALRSSYGWGRRLYRWVGRSTTAAYLEVSARSEPAAESLGDARGTPRRQSR